jgi:hypothetical protein
MKILCYNINTYKLKEIEQSVLDEWLINNNPKSSVWAVAPEKPGDNYVWNNGQWIQIITPIPESISARQIRMWLVLHNISLEAVETAINSIEDPIQKQLINIEWEYAPYVERNHPWINTLGSILGLNSEQIDNAFIEASVL